VQSDTKWGHNAALKHYKGKDFVKLPRTGLGGPQFKSDLFSGFNDVINVLAKNDPRFADLQMIANEKVSDANHKLMGFNVHELHKKGVEGSLGDKPWLDQTKNAEELGKAIIQYLEQGAEYYSIQGALNDIGKMLIDPDVSTKMPNSKEVVYKHIKHVTGQDINPIGSALNWALDALPRMAGVSYRVPAEAVRSTKNVMSMHLMGWYNPTFLGMQLTQPIMGALPELMKVGSKLDMTTEIPKSVSTAPGFYAVIKASKAMGKDIPNIVPDHLKEAASWGEAHGIMSFSEMELAHSATRNQKMVNIEKVGGLPMSLGEKMTRPPVFMTFVDIFHKFGLDNENAFRAAQHATNMAMADYHPHERPRIYSQLGIVGEFAGALTTYKHNMGTQTYFRARDAITADAGGKRQYGAAAAAGAAGAFFYGITGAPGYEDLDNIFQFFTAQLGGDRKTIREAALSDVPEWAKSGMLSAATGLDFQTRMSMGNLLPEVSGATLSPQLAALGDMFVAAAKYGKYQDEQSFKELARAVTPSGMRGMTEDALLTDEEGFVQNTAGERLFEEPRSEKERDIRKAFAIRPLRETLEQKDTYVDGKNVLEKDRKLKDWSKRFRQSFVVGDTKGMERAAQKFYDLEGSPEELLNSEAIQNQLLRANQTQRERLTGKLQASIRSVNRWRDMNDGD
jgi:hypothetical protein